MNRLLEFFEYKIQNEGTFENRRRHIFTRCTLIVIFSLFLFTLSHTFQSKTYSALIDGFGLFINILNLFFYKKFGNYKWSMFTTLSSTLIIIAIQHMIAPFSLQSNTLWFTIFVFASVFLLTKKQTHYAFIVVLLIGILSELVHQTGFFNINEFSLKDSKQINLISVIMSLLASYLISRVVMSSEKNTLKRLEQKNKESIALSEEYAALVSVLGHDLSNQVFIINLQAEHAMKKIKETDPVYKNMAMIYKVSTEMSKFMKQIKHYKANQDGKIAINLERVNPIIAINSSLEYFRDKLAEKDIDLYFAPPRQISHILAEPVSLVSSVLNNILNNAIKFTTAKGIISIHLYEKDDYVNIKITDTGIGMPDDIIQNLFSMKRETSRRGTNGEKGTGFGMPILKLYMDKYGGDVIVSSVESGKHKGTSFKLVFKKF